MYSSQWKIELSINSNGKLSRAFVGEVTRTIAITAYGHIDSREFPVDQPLDHPLLAEIRSCTLGALIKHLLARAFETEYPALIYIRFFPPHAKSDLRRGVCVCTFSVDFFRSKLFIRNDKRFISALSSYTSSRNLELVSKYEYRPAGWDPLGGDLLEFREGKRSDEVRGIVLVDAVESRGQVTRSLDQMTVVGCLADGAERALPLARLLGRSLASHVSRLHLVSLLPHLAQAYGAVKPART